jgi:S1-C subfamily serine protease
MAIKIRFRGGPLAGKVFSFGDEFEQIVIGRDEAKCQLVLPADLTSVGRQHLALRQVLGRYRLVLNRDNEVLVDGRPAMNDMELPPVAELRLGAKGPALLAETQAAAGIPATDVHKKPAPGVHTRLERAERGARGNRRIVAGIVVGVAALAVAGFLVLSQQEGEISKIKELSGTMEKSVQAELARYDQEWASVKSTIGADRETIARLIVERGERARQLDELREEQNLSEADRRELEKQFRSKLEDAEKKLLALNEKVSRDAGHPEDWAKLATQYEKAIFLFVGRKRVGADDYVTIGTGFCIRADGLLATNAHVVSFFADQDSVVAYQNVTGQAFKVARSRAHPTYRPDRLFQPDVALVSLSTRDGSALPSFPTLPLAGPDELRAVTVGTELGTLGYPAEFIWEYVEGSQEASAPRAHATFKTGFVGRVTAYDLTRRGFADDRLIQHSALTTGGTSGSPLFTRDGKVVSIHHAGRKMEVVLSPGSAGGPPIAGPVAEAGIRWGVRIDELSDFVRQTGW